jgi:hypothetical protein
VTSEPTRDARGMRRGYVCRSAGTDPVQFGPVMRESPVPAECARESSQAALTLERRTFCGHPQATAMCWPTLALRSRRAYDDPGVGELIR